MSLYVGDMVDFSLSQEEQDIQQTARAFAQAEIGPAAAAIRSREPGVSPWEIMRPVFKHAHDLSMTSILIPEEYGGLGGSCFDNVLVMEEFGAVDQAVAASYFNVTTTSPILLMLGANEEQKRKWLTAIATEDDHILASASSEPDVAGADTFYPGGDPAIGLKTSARLDGDSYVLNGAKSAFSTNAGAAKTYFVMARTDRNKPVMESVSMFLVPADTPGVHFGHKTELFGWKSAMHGDVYFEDARIPVENRIGAEGANNMFFFQALPYLSSGLAATYVGMARAAFDLAWDYANERKSWGQPIINHQAVALKLADMMTDLEAARLMVWQVAWAADRGDPRVPGILAPAAKTFAVEVAIRNAERAMRILGAYGVTEEYPAARMLADAWVGDSCDGTRDMLRLSMVDFTRMMRNGSVGGPLGPPPGGPGGPPPGGSAR